MDTKHAVPIHNRSDSERVVILEPIADVVRLAPGESATIVYSIDRGDQSVVAAW